ncbi:MAG: thrombospondin type 3 repeat-containing protein [Patescibacteria group bacterium]
MFDSAPSNLPVEPAGPAPAPVLPTPEPEIQVPSTVASTAPLTPRPTPRPLSTAPLKKEPEDIFSGLNTGGDDSSGSAPIEMEPEPHQSPVKFIALAFLIIVLVAGIGFAVWYFFIHEKPVETGIITPTSTNSPVVIAQDEPVIETPPALPPEPGTNTPPPNIPPPQSINTSTPATQQPPTIQIAEAADSDADGVSDPEEATLGTGATMPDSDGDGFTDGSELQNGYDPAATNLSIAGSPRYHNVSISSTLGVYVPAAWSVTSDPTASGRSVIVTGTPTSFIVEIGSRPVGTAFADWLNANDPSADASAMRSFTTRAGYAAHMTFDRLHSYIEVPGSMVVITYSAGSASSYDFRAIYDYIVQTMRIR